MKPQNRKLLMVALIIGGLVVLAALIVYLSTCSETELSVITAEFVSYLCCLGIAMVAVIPFAGIVALTLSFLNWQSVRAALCLAAHRVSAKIVAKNAATVYPCLQQFLFFVLSQNREFLNLPLGKDASCLLPGGYALAYRNGCVFYRFQLVAKDTPDMEFGILRLVVQNYITSELINHGIAGLPSSFSSANIGTLPSVFLDRVFYERGRHYLTFDILFVDNGEAAKYVANAIQFDTAPKQTETEVFEDDF